MAFWGEKDSFYLPKMHFLNVDLNLVSTASQRLHISEFEFYFKVASTFMSTDTFSSTEPQQQKCNRRKLQKDNQTDKTFTFKNTLVPVSLSYLVLWLLLAEL